MSSPRRIGLPDTIRMRHDTHFVDQLMRPSGESIGRLIPIEEIDPNPHQPRHSMGDLAELTASIREKGVLEPLLVRRHGSRYQIIAGERRYRAAAEAGISELPCVIRESSDAETMEIALIENLQRKDLTPFEEADGLRVLAERFGYTHEDMAEKLGKSRTTITESLSLATMPDEVRELCRLADITSKSLLLQIVRQGDSSKMMGLIERLQSQGSGTVTRAEARAIAASREPKRGRPRNFVFKLQPKGGSFSLALQFKKAQVEREEIIRTLEEILESLRASN
jgi:ParB family chromosome partitioning protein